MADGEGRGHFCYAVKGTGRGGRQQAPRTGLLTNGSMLWDCACVCVCVLGHGGVGRWCVEFDFEINVTDCLAGFSLLNGLSLFVGACCCTFSSSFILLSAPLHPLLPSHACFV